MLWILFLCPWKVSAECRDRLGEFFPREEFKLAMCAAAYVAMPASGFPGGVAPFLYSRKTHELVNRSHFSHRVAADPQDPVLRDSFLSSKFADNWAERCEEADKCCQKMLSDPPTAGDDHCPRTWDGIGCWPDTPANDEAVEECKAHHYLFGKMPSCTHFAKKVCWPNATWFRKSDPDREYTDYSGCSRVRNTKTKMYFHIAAFSLSILLLVPAILIFIIYRQLQVIRVLIHLNLFISLAMNGVLVISFELYVMSSELQDEETVLDKNQLSCRVLSVLTKYFRLSSYMWMLCEGYYLHKLFIAAFTDQKKVWRFLSAGWGFPIIVLTVYSVLKALYADHSCWAFSSENFEWVVNAPMVATLLVNIIFLSIISVVLITNLRKSGSSHKYSRAARGTLFLVPLFGVHLVFIIYSPPFKSCLAQDIYVYVKYLVDGLQGFVVALLFCFMNKEVNAALKRTLYKFRQQKEVETQRSRRLTSDASSVSTRTSVVSSGNAFPLMKQTPDE